MHMLANYRRAKKWPCNYTTIIPLNVVAVVVDSEISAESPSLA